MKMTALEIITLVLSAISIGVATLIWIESWRSAVEKKKMQLLADFFSFAAILKSAQPSMKKELSEKQREVITRIVWRHSGVSLTSILDIPEERYYILQALADPSKYPWDKESPDDTV